MRSLLRCLPFVALAAAALVPAAAQRPTLRPAPALTFTYANLDAYIEQRGVVVPLDTLLFVASPGRFEARVPRVTGTVYVYALRRGAYVLTDSVTAPQGLNLGSEFGRAVVAHGKTLVIGAPGARSLPDANFPEFPSGVVFVYTRQADGRYRLTQRIERPTDEVSRFGGDAHVEGDAMVLGARSASNGFSQRLGGTFSYVRESASWVYRSQEYRGDVQYPSLYLSNGLKITKYPHASIAARVRPGRRVPEGLLYPGGVWYGKDPDFGQKIDGRTINSIHYDSTVGRTRVLDERLRYFTMDDVARPGEVPFSGPLRSFTFVSDTTLSNAGSATLLDEYALVTVRRTSSGEDRRTVVLALFCPSSPPEGAACRYVGRFVPSSDAETEFGASDSGRLSGTMRGAALASSLEVTPGGAYVVRHYVLRPAFTSTSAEAPPRTAAALRVRVWPSVVASGTPVRVAVEGGGGGACRLSLADALGRETTLPVGGNADAVEVSTSGLASGVYRVRASCAAGASASAALVVRR